MKTCRTCRVEQPLSDFYFNQGYPRSECKSCVKLRRKKTWRVNGEEILERRRKRYSPEKRRAAGLRGLYGITLEDFEAMLVAQGGACAVCGKTRPGGRGNRFHVDHDHVTDRIRGLLCTSCNLILGHAKDQIPVLAALIGYLQKAVDTERPPLVVSVHGGRHEDHQQTPAARGRGV
jgi:hypothetical protein